jgi:hypothetical protein
VGLVGGPGAARADHCHCRGGPAPTPAAPLRTFRAPCALRPYHRVAGQLIRRWIMSSMVELVVAAVALASACIFLAHAIEAYRAH